MKRLIVCYDGTWKKEQGDRASNVIRLMRHIAARDGDVEQVVFYDPGVGTGGAWDRLRGGSTGHGLRQNIRDGYIWLGNNWSIDADGRPDEIVIFGFSRGAFTARSLAGMIGRVGLLDRVGLRHLDAAWRRYQGRKEEPLAPYPDGIVAATPRIRLVGVFDTVGALGIPALFGCIRRRGDRFHDTHIGHHIDVGLQALALDERRRSFRATLWTADPARPATAHVEQVWFPGVHSDVGGGYAEQGLAGCSLEWMMERAEALGAVLFRRWDTDPADPAGLLHASPDGLFRWSPRFVRPVMTAHRACGRAAGPGINESVHSSVRKRIDADAAPALVVPRFPLWPARRRQVPYRPPQLPIAQAGDAHEG